MVRLYKNTILLLIFSFFFVLYSAAAQANIKAEHFAPGQLETHYQKHSSQFGSITQEQYLHQAQDFLNAPVSADVLEKSRPNGDVLRYRVSTGEFAVMTKTGRIRTYFKTNQHYWMKQ